MAAQHRTDHAGRPVPGDLRFAFADVDGKPPDTIGITAIEVGVADGRVFAEPPDGTRLPFAEFFFLLSISVVDAWKGISEGAEGRPPPTSR